MTTAQYAKHFPRCEIVRPMGARYMWRVYEPYVERACAESYAASDNEVDVQRRIIDGEMLLIQIGTDCGMLACAVLEVIDTKDGQALHVMGLAGEGMEFWLDDFIDFLQATARHLECESVTATGRKGWEKRLARYGFEHAFTGVRWKL